MANEFVTYEKLKIFLENIKSKIATPLHNKYKLLSNRVSALEQRGGGGGGGGTSSNFVARNEETPAPQPGDPHWTNVKWTGGMNIYSEENEPYGHYGQYGFVLANCTSYVYGRLLEIRDTSNCESVHLPQEDWAAYVDENTNFFKHMQQEGVETGDIPKLGAVACWKDRSRGMGHVAIVESVSEQNGIYNINISDSWYGHPDDHWYSVDPMSSSNNYYFGSTWEFMGFCYNVTLSEAPIQDLATVAYTGEYGDLLNTPVIPADIPKKIHYTTEEQDTGLTFIDGKKIYQITVNYEGYAAAGAFELPVELPAMDSVPEYSAIMRSSSSPYRWFNGHFFGSHTATTWNDCKSSIFIDSTNKKIYKVGSESWGNLRVIVTIRYTKP